MSLVVAIRDKNRVVLGADKQITAGDFKDHITTKIWPLEELPGAVMGSVGSARASQIIQYSNVIDKNMLVGGDIDTDFVICSLAPTLAAGLKANGVKVQFPEDGDTEMMPNSFIFAYKDRAWMIWNDLSVSELDEYFAIGSGADVARGALFATRKLNPFERIAVSIDAAAEYTLFVDNGIDIVATDYLENDDKLIAKAVGVSVDEDEPKHKPETKKQAKKPAKK